MGFLSTRYSSLVKDRLIHTFGMLTGSSFFNLISGFWIVGKLIRVKRHPKEVRK